VSLSGPIVALALLLTAGSSGAAEHLLAGARQFRAGRYAEALVEFRVAQRLGSAEASSYGGAALVKLGRYEEALEAFGGVEGTGPDALMDYYRAVAAYEARLYVAADRLLASVGERAGPKIAEQAARLRADIAAALRTAPPTSTTAWYLARCAELRGQKRDVLAAAYCREATDLSPGGSGAIPAAVKP
jgi:tetratricopeptide (TPR) repeat protein